MNNIYYLQYEKKFTVYIIKVFKKYEKKKYVHTIYKNIQYFITIKGFQVHPLMDWAGRGCLYLDLLLLFRFVVPSRR